MSAVSKIAPPVGLWFSDVGPLDTIYMLFRYKDNGDRLRSLEALLASQPIRESFGRVINDMVQNRYNKVLVPAPFSPMQ